MIRSFKHKVNIQIRFKDIDKLGHVNNATYLSYLETARMSYFRQVIGTTIDWVKTGMILAKVNIDYKLPVVLEDELFVYTRITRFGTKSFDISNCMVKVVNNEEKICCTAVSVIVCMNYETKETSPVPQLWKDRVQAFEGEVICS